MGQNEQIMQLFKYLLITADPIQSASWSVAGGTMAGNCGNEQDFPVGCCSYPQHCEGIKASGCQEFQGHEAPGEACVIFHSYEEPKVNRLMIPFIHAIPEVLKTFALYEHPLINNVNNDPSEMFFIEENHKVLWPN